MATPRDTDYPEQAPAGLRFKVGEHVRCIVHGAEGEHHVLAVRASDGYLKIDGCRSWCPPYNFRTA